MSLDSRLHQAYATEEGPNTKRPIISKRCFYGSSLQTLQRDFRVGNNGDLSRPTVSVSRNMSRVEQFDQKTKQITKSGRTTSSRHSNTRHGKKARNNIRFDADGFKLPNKEAPSSMDVENFREVRSYLVRRAQLLRLMEEHPEIMSLRLPKLPGYLKHKMIKNWVNFKIYQATHKLCRSITYVNGDTRIRMATNRPSVVTDDPLRTDADIGFCISAIRRSNGSNPASESDDPSTSRMDADIGSCKPALRRSNSSSPAPESDDPSSLRTDADIRFCIPACSNPRVLASDDPSTLTSAGSSFRADAKASTANSPNSILSISESHVPTLERPTHEFPKEAYVEDVVDESTSFGLELIRLNYENSTKTQENEGNDLINVNVDHESARIDARKDHYGILKVRTTVGRSFSGTLGSLKCCSASLKRIDNSRRKSRRIKHGLQAIKGAQSNLMQNSNKHEIQRNNQFKSSTAILNRLPKDERVNGHSLKHIDKPRRKSRRMKHGLQAIKRDQSNLMQNSNQILRNNQTKLCSAILNPLPKDERVNEHTSIGDKVSFPTDYKRHYSTNSKYQEHGNPVENSVKPCYVKLRRLDSAGKKAQFPVAGQLWRTEVKECSVNINRIEWNYAKKSTTTTCVPLRRPQVTSEMCDQNQKSPEIREESEEQGGTIWVQDLKRCSVLVERLD